MFTLRNFEAKTISWWYDQRPEIDFSPPYQRKGRLWSAHDKAYLIDSILNGFDMPKIYLADFTFSNSELNRTRKLFAVVDGKQRLEAIFDFYENKITLDRDIVLLDNPLLKIGGLSYNDLKSQYPKVASKFDNFNLSVISIITDNESMINEMFIRLNNSKPLTGAELRNAAKGSAPKLIKQLVQHVFFTNRVRFATVRGQDANVAAKLLLIEFRGKFVDLQRRQLDMLVNDVVLAETDNLESAYEKIKNILDVMSKMFIDKDPLLRSSGLIPVYYMFVKFVDIKAYKKVRPFLVEFDMRRKADDNLAYGIDYTLFNTFTRSINTQANLQGCLSILLKKFGEYQLTQEALPQI